MPSLLSPLNQPLTYDLDQSLAALRIAATRYAGSRDYLPRDLMIAAVAFTVQLALESDHEPAPLRALERELIAHIEAVSPRLWEDPDMIIEVRDTLLAKSSSTLSVPDQNLLRDCDIALGVVRRIPKEREEARTRVLRAFVGFCVKAPA